MKLTQEEKNEVREMVDTMLENLNSIKNLFKSKMENGEYSRFKHNTLSMLEPGLTAENPWVVGSNIEPLDQLVDEIGVDEDEIVECCECGQPLDKNGDCNNEECLINKPL